MHIFARICTSLNIFVRLCTYLHICQHICTYLHIFLHMHTSLHIFDRFAYICTYLYIYAHIYMPLGACRARSARQRTHGVQSGSAKMKSSTNKMDPGSANIAPRSTQKRPLLRRHQKGHAQPPVGEIPKPRQQQIRN